MIKPILLIIDDDKEVLNINSQYLTNEGFQVYTDSNPLNAIRQIPQYHPDCILLDIMMPKADGFEVCKKIRTFSNVPIIFLSGRNSENDKILGLTSGADDYIVKPYSLRELKARIDTILRRTANIQTAAATVSLLTINGLKIDKITHKVFCQEQDLQLANREYEVLLYLASNPDRDITFEEIGTALFGSYQESDRRSVMVYMSRLRQKISGFHELDNIIQTVWAKGYRFNTPQRKSVK